MSKRTTRLWLPLIAGLCLLLSTALAGQLPAGLTEAGLASVERSEVLGKLAEIHGTPANAMARDVLRRLISTPLANSMPYHPLRYSVELLSAPAVNAFAIGNGEVFVEQGLLPYLGNVPGYWAAVLGHETGHNLAHHVYRNYLAAVQRQRTIAQLQQQARAGSKTASIALLAYAVGGGIAAMKFSRDEENQADHIGLELMAQAGYHPDFMLSLYRHLELQMGDQSHVAAFFSDHPRWDTREQKTQASYRQALATFHQQWPDTARSPGGMPPPYGDLGTPAYQVNAATHQVVLQIPIRVRHAAGETITIAAMRPRKHPSSSGWLPQGPPGLRLDLPVTAQHLRQVVTLRLPPYDPRRHQLTVEIGLLTPTDMLDLHTWKFNLNRNRKPKEVR